MSLPSARELFERLRTIYETGADETLATRLPFSLSTLNRWKDGKEPKAYWSTLEMLEAAGWLNTSAEQPPIAPSQPDAADALADLRVAVDGTFALVQDVQARMERLEARLPEPQPQRGSGDHGTPRKRTGA